MKFLDMLFNDPIVFYSAIGLAILMGIGAFYIYYFIKHIQEDSK